MGKLKQMSIDNPTLDGELKRDPADTKVYQTENIEETYPLKKFEVSYDIEVKPLTPDILRRGRKQWKRVSEIVEATRFREARKIVMEKFKNSPKERKIKSIDVSEVRG